MIHLVKQSNFNRLHKKLSYIIKWVLAGLTKFQKFIHISYRLTFCRLFHSLPYRPNLIGTNNYRPTGNSCNLSDSQIIIDSITKLMLE